MKTQTFQRAALALAVAGGLALPMLAQAQATPWMVRVHALNLDSANKDSTGLDLTVNNKVFPEVDISYFFTPNIAAELVLGAFKPYVGAGLNYTHFSNVSLPAGVDIKRNSYGLAVGAGFDYEIQKGIYFNVDVKKVQIKTTVSAGGSDIGKFKVDPLLLGVGVGFRF